MENPIPIMKALVLGRGPQSKQTRYRPFQSSGFAIFSTVLELEMLKVSGRLGSGDFGIDLGLNIGFDPL